MIVDDYVTDHGRGKHDKIPMDTTVKRTFNNRASWLMVVIGLDERHNLPSALLIGYVFI